MGSINMSRVLLGGLVAGLIIDVFEGVLNGVILAKDWETAMLAMNKQPVTTNAIIAFNIWGIVLGIAAVWTYAAIRPRFGPGPKTGVIAGALVWVLCYFLGSVGLIVMGLFPANLMMIGLAVGAVEIVLATTVGARLYQESPEASSLSAAAR